MDRKEILDRALKLYREELERFRAELTIMNMDIPLNNVRRALFEIELMRKELHGNHSITL